MGFFLPCVLIKRVFQAAYLRFKFICVTEYVSLRFLPLLWVGAGVDFFGTRFGPFLVLFVSLLCLVSVVSLVLQFEVLFVVVLGVLFVLFVGCLLPVAPSSTT